MSRKFLLKNILTVLVLVLAGCADNEHSESTLSESEQREKIQKLLAKAPKHIAERDDIPVWLSEFIDALEPDNSREVAAYRANWKGAVVYYVSDEYFSCIMCTTFDSDGEQLDWARINPKEFLESATDWECIYFSNSKFKDK